MYRGLCLPLSYNKVPKAGDALADYEVILVSLSFIAVTHKTHACGVVPLSTQHPIRGFPISGDKGYITQIVRAVLDCFGLIPCISYADHRHPMYRGVSAMEGIFLSQGKSRQIVQRSKICVHCSSSFRYSLAFYILARKMLYLQPPHPRFCSL